MLGECAGTRPTRTVASIIAGYLAEPLIENSTFFSILLFLFFGYAHCACDHRSFECSDVHAERRSTPLAVDASDVANILHPYRKRRREPSHRRPCFCQH